MSSPQTTRPGDASYRAQVTSNPSLLLRWSTEADAAGIAMVSSLAFAATEGEEPAFPLRFAQLKTMKDFYSGRPNDWALCVDTSGPQDFPAKPKDKAADGKETEDETFVAKIRAEASSQQESVVAVICWDLTTLSFDNGSADIKVGVIYIVAQRSKYRTGPEVMKGLFKMVHDRGTMQGVACHMVAGIPSYYRTHEYDYALHVGRASKTVVSSLPSSIRNFTTPTTTLSGAPATTTVIPSLRRSIYHFRDAAPNDIPALARLWDLPKSRSDIWWQIYDYVPNLVEVHLSCLIQGGASPLVGLLTNSKAIHLDEPTPFWVLEKVDSSTNEKKVAAAVIFSQLPSRKMLADAIEENKPLSLMVKRILWDSETDLNEVVDALMKGLVRRAETVFAAILNGDEEGKDESSASVKTQPKLDSILWVTSVGEPLVQMLKTLDWADDRNRPGHFEVQSDVMIHIHSLTTCLRALQPALQARLSNASHLLGKAYTHSVRIQTFRASHLGSIIRIKNGSIASIEDYPVLPIHRKAHLFKGDGAIDEDEDADGNAKEPEALQPNVMMPQGLLTQVLMGYKTWRELKDGNPDVMVHMTVARVLDVLFPKRVMSGFIL